MLAHPDLGFVDGGVDFRQSATYGACSARFGVASAMPRRAYTSAVFQELENEKVWTRDWVCIGTSSRDSQSGRPAALYAGRTCDPCSTARFRRFDWPVQQGPAWRLSRGSRSVSNWQKDQMLVHVLRTQPGPRCHRRRFVERDDATSRTVFGCLPGAVAAGEYPHRRPVHLRQRRSNSGPGHLSSSP